MVNIWVNIWYNLWLINDILVIYGNILWLIYGNDDIMIYWLVLDPSEKWWSSSVGMMTFPIYGKITHSCSKTTNQLYMWHSVSNNLNSTNTSTCRNRIIQGDLAPSSSQVENPSAWSAERSANPSTSQPQRQDRGHGQLQGCRQVDKKAWAQDAAGSSKRNIPLPTGRPAQQLKPIWHQKTSDSSNCDESWISPERVNDVIFFGKVRY